MIEEGVAALGDGNGFIDAEAVRVPSLEHVAAIVLQQDIFPIIDVPSRNPFRYF